MSTNDEHTPVRPIAPVVGYIGGKRKLAPHLLPWIESAPHACYAEVFAGMLGLFLQRRLRPKAEVINDISKDVGTFFRILQRHYTPFIEMLRYQITCRQEFDRLVNTDADTLTDLERSARFLYLQACAFGGKVSGRTFGVQTTAGGIFDLTRIGPLLEAAHTRLSGVVIENLDFKAFIDRYDAPHTLFYADPPYVGCEAYYGKNVFGTNDFHRLADSLRAIEGRCVVSLNESEIARAAFSDFLIEVVPYRYTVARGDQAAAQELIIIGPPCRIWEKRHSQGTFL